ncbi:MAG TPA: hypothetical protein VD902_16275 [Symbiobacteriaceae bacterium]|nr:hypothetical protein [Symbiobacteriaceae bacterium]
MGVRPSRPVLLGLLMGLTVLLQLGPVYLPGAGAILSAAATLPTAVAALVIPRRCTWFYLAASFLMGLVAVEEMFIFLLMTGPLGLMLALTFRWARGLSVLASAATLTGGMLLLPTLGGVWPWGGLERLWPAWLLAVGYMGFALAYSALWRVLLARLLTRLPWQGYTEGNEPS